MVGELLATEIETQAAPERLPPAERAKLLFSAGAVMLLLQLALPAAGFIGIPILFFLKRRLHLDAQGVANFNLWAGIPLYLSFVFGLLRDRWSPAGKGDRGHLILFGLVTGAVFTLIAFLPPTYPLLLGGVIAVTTGVQAAWSATQGLVSHNAQEHAMSGQTSTAINLAGLLSFVVAFAGGGFLSTLLDGRSAMLAARMLFLTGAALMLAVALFGAIGPRRLFDPARIEKPPESLLADIVRLAKCKSIYAPLIIQVLWQFGPAGGVALQYHFVDHLHASASQVGLWFAWQLFWIIPSTAAYAWLCQRVRLATLLWCGAIMGVPQWAPLLFVHSMAGAFVAAVPIGFVAGLAQAAYIDVTIRACPPRLQGTMMMLLWSAYYIPLRIGDVFGAWLYEKEGGLGTAIWATIAVYALILPVLLLIPKRLTATADGEAVVDSRGG